MWASDSVRDIDPAELRSAGALFAARYVGTAHQRYGTSRSYIDDCHAAGVGVLLIFEEWGSQFLGGRDAALASCDRMMAAWDRLGAPRDGSTVPAVVLIDPTPGIVLGNEQALRDYAAGWDEALPFPEWTGYGSRYGLDIAGQVAGRMTRRWGVRTWGYQTGSPPDMVQEPDLAAPLPVPADYNTLYRPDMGQWESGGRPMATGQDLVDAAAGFLGQRYSTAPGRDDPNSQHKDCSGLIAAAYLVATGQELGANVSVTIFDLCASQGLEIPVAEAYATAGACIFKPDNPYAGWGPAGHIAFSDGNGGTVEATPPRVQRLPLSYNAPWSPRACLLPGIDYSGGTTPAPVPASRGADMERLVKNSDLPDGQGWWYFPPVGHAVAVGDPLEVIALAQTGIPHFAAPGQSIVAADLRRADTKKP